MFENTFMKRHRGVCVRQIKNEQFAKIKVVLTRLSWQLFTFYLTAKKRTVDPPDKYVQFRDFEALVNSGLVSSLIKTYQLVFRSSPAWQEDHQADQIKKRLEVELGHPSVITLVRAQISGDDVVGGFCWGQCLTMAEILCRCKSALSFSHFTEADWLTVESILVKRLKDERTVFVHEIGVLPEYRGIEALQFLFRPVLEMGWENNLKTMLWWTNKKSNAFRLSLIMGFEPLIEIGELVFLFTPNLVPILKAISHFDSAKIARILTSASYSRGVRR